VRAVEAGVVDRQRGRKICGRRCSDLCQTVLCSSVRGEIAERVYIWDAEEACGHQSIAERGRSPALVTRRSANCFAPSLGTGYVMRQDASRM
jgi:hypothetical protein